MRILIANDGLDDAGGVNTYLEVVVAGLQERAHEVLFVHRNKASTSCPSGLAKVARRVCLETTGLSRGLRAIEDFAPDCCFSHNMRFLEVEEALVGRWRTFKFMHIFLGTCVSGTKTTRFPGSKPCGRSFGPGCITAYFPRHCGKFSVTALTNGYRWAARQQDLFPRYAAVAVASRYMEREFLANGVPPSRLHRIPLFVHGRHPAGGGPATLADMEKSKGRFVDDNGVGQLIFVGRMTSLKAPALAVEAAAVAGRVLGRPFELTLIGDGPEREKCEMLSAKLGIRCHFEGWRESATRNTWFRDKCLMIIPSIWPEPFGLVGLEGAAFGVPSVAFDVGGISEWLEDGVSGCLSPSEELTGGSLGQTIAKALSSEPRWNVLSDGACAATKRFTLTAHLNSLEHVLKEVVQSSKLG